MNLSHFRLCLNILRSGSRVMCFSRMQARPARRPVRLRFQQQVTWEFFEAKMVMKSSKNWDKPGSVFFHDEKQ